VFQFRVGLTPAKPVPSKPKTWKTPAPLPIPVAQPVIPVKKPRQSVTAPPHDAPHAPFALPDEEEPLVKHSFRPNAGSGKRFLILAAGWLVGILIAVGSFMAIRSNFTGARSGILLDKNRVIVGNIYNQKKVEEKAFKIILPNKSWIPDNDRRKRMGVITAWKSTDKDKEGWFAVNVHDYGQTRPRDAELLRTGIDRLEQYFEGSLELAEKAEPSTVCETQGQRLLFKGQMNSVTWWGYMFMLAHEGFGYWLYVAAPSKESAEEMFAKELQGTETGFLLATDRKGWREQPQKRETFATRDGVLTLVVPEGVFEKHSAKDQDERGELFLFAKYQKEQDNRKNADVLVLALEKQGDLKEGMKTTKKYLEDKKTEESKDYKIAMAGEGSDQSDLGISAAVGNRPGRIAEFKLLRGETAARFWMVGVVNAEDKAYVIRCDCNWESRQIWREDFQELMRSLQLQSRAR